MEDEHFSTHNRTVYQLGARSPLLRKSGVCTILRRLFAFCLSHSVEAHYDEVTGKLAGFFAVNSTRAPRRSSLQPKTAPARIVASHSSIAGR